MKSIINRFSVSFASLDTRYIKLAFILVALGLSVIGAGAPESGGGPGG